MMAAACILDYSCCRLLPSKRMPEQVGQVVLKINITYAPTGGHLCCFRLVLVMNMPERERKKIGTVPTNFKLHGLTISLPPPNDFILFATQIPSKLYFRASFEIRFKLFSIPLYFLSIIIPNYHAKTKIYYLYMIIVLFLPTKPYNIAPQIHYHKQNLCQVYFSYMYLL